MMDEQAMYDALPPDQQRKIEQGYQRALIIAQDLRAEGERYAALCDAIEDALERKAAIGYVGDAANANPESALHYA